MLKIATLLLCSAAFAVAQSPPEQRQTQTPLNARYEIFVSGWEFRHTLRLDKFTGQLWEWKQDTTEARWVEMQVEGLPNTAEVSPRFQLVEWNLQAERTFLLDTANGQTWRLTQADGSSPRIWKRFATPQL
jgi:hypothetical protein